MIYPRAGHAVGVVEDTAYVFSGMICPIDFDYMQAHGADLSFI